MNTFLLPIYAIIIGVIIAYFSKSKNTRYTKLLLSFSGAFLLALTLFDLLPEVYNDLEAKQAGLFIMCGILLQIILEFFSRGAEHGHVHMNQNENVFPWLLFTSLCIHSFLEGFPIHQHNDMVYGILVHKIPIAILITTYLINSGFKPLQVGFFLIVFGLMTPLGTFISNQSEIIPEIIYKIDAIAIGIFLHISTTILFESSHNHKFNLSKLVVIALAIVLAYYM